MRRSTILRLGAAAVRRSVGARAAAVQTLLGEDYGVRWIENYSCFDEPGTEFMGSDGIVLGGTFQYGDWNTAPDPATERRILRCTAGSSPPCARDVK